MFGAGRFNHVGRGFPRFRSAVAGTHAVLVSEADGHRLWCALNLGENEVSLPVPGAGNRLAGTGEIEAAGDDAQVRLPAHGWAVLD